MKPSQVDEQHSTLFNPEYNYNHKVVKSKKNKEDKRRAEEEIRRYVKEVDYDEGRI